MKRLLVVLVALACAGESERAAETLEIAVAGERLTVELALDYQTRFRGLGGRDVIPKDGGMLFVFPNQQRLGAVMRDVRIPLDVAFLDRSGRVVAMHAMLPEPPREPGEGGIEYEERLTPYWSGAPAQFMLETAAGRLFGLGLQVGDRIAVDPDLVRRAR